MKSAHKNKKFLHHYQKRINSLLVPYLSTVTHGAPKELIKALRYGVLGGGKRIRALLIYGIGKTYGANIKCLDVAAAAIEMIHAFSLIHDDLPAMDNDTLRRGKPTCHIAFDEATAILAGDALLVAAFQLLAQSRVLTAAKKAAMIKILAEASGPMGLASGQYLDLHPQKGKPSKTKLEKMYLLKTGALISAAVKLGALAANINQKKLRLLEQLALTLGLAFQIQDDILNIEGDVNKMGKNIGTDIKQNKITYPTLIGSKKAKLKLETLWRKIQKNLQQLKIADGGLQELAHYVMHRES